MITLFRNDTTYPLKDIKEHMLREIGQLPHKVAAIGNNPTILRFEFLTEHLDILTWLNNQNTSNKIYWSNRQHDFEVGGIGAAHICEGQGAVNYRELFDAMEDHLSSDNSQLRYYGGFSFNDTSLDTEWKDFGHYRFVIPQFELLSAQGKTLFAFNIVIDEITEDNIKKILKTCEAVNFSKETIYKRPPPEVQSRHDFPDRDSWNKLLTQLIDQNGKTKYEKVVLARKTIFDFDRPINPIALIKHLKDMTPNCFHFCFQTSDHHAFLGASPERLFKRTENRIETEALAGTMPRGKNPNDERQFEEDLLNSPKLLNEHNIVVKEIKKTLKDFCEQLDCDKTFTVIKLNEGQHLLTKFRGTLQKNIGNDELISHLHPTPAVGGAPRESVLPAINKLEPFSRGWYAAPIGYVGYDTAEFAVAIRSGLVDQNKLSLYAGAGIVTGSTAEKEWEEIEYKISSFLKVFGR